MTSHTAVSGSGSPFVDAYRTFTHECAQYPIWHLATAMLLLGLCQSAVIFMIRDLAPPPMTCGGAIRHEVFGGDIGQVSWLTADVVALVLPSCYRWYDG